MKEIKEFKIAKETPKAYLIEIENKSFWFPKSKVKIENNVLSMEEDLFEKNTKSEIVEDKIKVFETLEDYSENSFKAILKIKKDDYEAEKFMFFPKSKILEHTEEFYILPKWIFEKTTEEILEKECNYFNEKYSESITTHDYEIITEFEEI